MPRTKLALSVAGLIICAATLQAQEPITWSPVVVLEDRPSSWARMAQLPDGSWLAAYMISTSPNSIRIKRSYDRMRTWQFITEISEPDRDLDNPSLCVLPDGTVELAIRSVISGSSYWIDTYRSTDDGNSFSYQSLVDWDQHVGGVYEPYLHVLPDGSLACLYTSETHLRDSPSYNQVLAEKVSYDGGYTWGPEIFAIAQPGLARPGEANIVELPGGLLAMFFEMCGTENCLGHVSYSSDGINWSGVGPVIPSTIQNIQVVAMANGLLVATSNFKQVVVSSDYSNSWVNTHQYSSVYGSWPGIYETSPNEFAIVLTGAGERGEAGEYIRFGTIDPANLQTGSVSSICRGPTASRPQVCW